MHLEPLILSDTEKHVHSRAYTQNEWYYGCLGKTAKDKCMYHASQREGVYSRSCEQKSCPMMCEREAAMCPLSQPIPKISNTQADSHQRGNVQCPKMHQQGVRVE